MSETSSDMLLVSVVQFAGVSLTIPEGAIRKGQNEDVFLAVCRDDKDRPKLTGEIRNYFPSFIFDKQIQKKKIFPVLAKDCSDLENNVSHKPSKIRRAGHCW